MFILRVQLYYTAYRVFCSLYCVILYTAGWISYEDTYVHRMTNGGLSCIIAIVHSNTESSRAAYG